MSIKAQDVTSSSSSSDSDDDKGLDLATKVNENGIHAGKTHFRLTLERFVSEQELDQQHIARDLARQFNHEWTGPEPPPLKPKKRLKNNIRKSHKRAPLRGRPPLRTSRSSHSEKSPERARSPGRLPRSPRANIHHSDSDTPRRPILDTKVKMPPPLPKFLPKSQKSDGSTSGTSDSDATSAFEEHHTLLKIQQEQIAQEQKRLKEEQERLEHEKFRLAQEQRDAWAIVEDPKTNRMYYYNKITEESTWERPSCLDTPIHRPPPPSGPPPPAPKPRPSSNQYSYQNGDSGLSKSRSQSPRSRSHHNHRSGSPSPRRPLPSRPPTSSRGKQPRRHPPGRLPPPTPTQAAIYRCGTCHNVLEGPHMEVDDLHRYHNDCLMCCQCGTSLSNVQFYMHENQLYCGHDYQLVVCQRCAGCGKAILGNFFMLEGAAWHEECIRQTSVNSNPCG